MHFYINKDLLYVGAGAKSGRQTGGVKLLNPDPLSLDVLLQQYLHFLVHNPSLITGNNSCLKAILFVLKKQQTHVVTRSSRSVALN